MARFDAYKFKSASVPMVLDVQTNLLSDLQTRVVVPLVPLSKAEKEVLPRLKPILQINGKDYVLMTTDIGTIRTKDLGTIAANLKDQHHTITGALDFLFQGF